VPTDTTQSHTHDTGNCHMSWPHAHVLASACSSHRFTPGRHGWQSLHSQEVR